MLDAVQHGLADVLTGPVARTIPRFHTDQVPAYLYDPAKAEQLLDAVGFPRGADGTRFKLRLIAPAIGDPYDHAGQFPAQLFRRIRVTPDLCRVDVPTFIGTIYGDYDFDLSMFHSSVTADPSIGSFIPRR